MKRNITLCLTFAICIGMALAKPTPFSGKKQHHASKAVFSKAGTSNLPQMTKRFFWSGTNDLWDAVDSMTSTYSATGVLTETVTNGKRKMVFMKSLDGLRTSELSLNYNQSTSVWDSLYLYQTFADSLGNDTLQKNFYYNQTNHSWTMDYGNRIVNTYNSYNQLTVMLTDNYDTTLGYYVHAEKYEFVYNSQGQGYQAQTSIWDTSTHAYVVQSKITNIVWHKWNTTFDNSVVASYKTLDNIGGGVYVDAARSRISYDSHDEIIQNVDEKFDGTTWYIDNQDTSILTYNADGALIVRIDELYDIGNEIYIKQWKTEYSNFVQSTGVNSLEELEVQVSVYPNPTSNRIIVDIPVKHEMQFELYNINGKKAQDEILKEATNQINLNVQEGIYFYQIRSSSGTLKSGKLIVN